MFFQLLEHKQSQMKTAATVAPNRRLHRHASCYFFAHLFACVCKKIQECDNQELKILRTQTFSDVISNSKRARTQFKLIGKLKILGKSLKQQKAFPARRCHFVAHLFAFVRKTTRKVIIKNSRIWDGTETFSHQISNSKRARTKFKLKGKSIKMLRKFRQ